MSVNRHSRCSPTWEKKNWRSRGGRRVMGKAGKQHSQNPARGRREGRHHPAHGSQQAGHVCIQTEKKSWSKMSFDRIVAFEREQIEIPLGECRVDREFLVRFPWRICVSREPKAGETRAETSDSRVLRAYFWRGFRRRVSLRRFQMTEQKAQSTAPPPLWARHMAGEEKKSPRQSNGGVRSGAGGQVMF